MSARRTVPRLETLAYAVRSLWGSHVICGGLVTGDIGVGQSHDSITDQYDNLQAF